MSTDTSESARCSAATKERGRSLAEAVGYAHRPAGVDTVVPPPAPAVELARMAVGAGAKPAWRLGGEDEW